VRESRKPEKARSSYGPVSPSFGWGKELYNQRRYPDTRTAGNRRTNNRKLQVQFHQEEAPVEKEADNCRTKERK
jgi:hypothetical protein